MAWSAFAALGSYQCCCCCCHGDITVFVWLQWRWRVSFWGRCSVASFVWKWGGVSLWVCLCPCDSVCPVACVSVCLTPPTHVAPTLVSLNPQPTGYDHEWTHSLSVCLSVSHTVFPPPQLSALLLSLQELTLTSQRLSALLTTACTHTHTHARTHARTHTHTHSGHESYRGCLHSYISL